VKYSYAPRNDVSVNDGTHIRRWSRKGRLTLYVTFPFRRGTSRFSKLFLMFKLNGYVHTDRNVFVRSQFRSVVVAERECLTWRNGSWPVCTCSSLIMWTQITVDRIYWSSQRNRGNWANVRTLNISTNYRIWCDFDRASS